MLSPLFRGVGSGVEVVRKVQIQFLALQDV